MSRILAADALLGLLLPFWQLVIGACVLVAVLLSLRRLSRRGSSRMVRALLVLGLAIIGVAAVGLVADSCDQAPAGGHPAAGAQRPADAAPAGAPSDAGALLPPAPPRTAPRLEPSQVSPDRTARQHSPG